MRLPDEIPIVGLDGGRPSREALPPLDGGVSLAPWRSLAAEGPLLVRSRASGLGWLSQVRRLSSAAELWLDTPLASVDAALDLLVAGASRLLVPCMDVDLLEAVGPSALVEWHGSTPWTDAQAWALENDAPILARTPVPADAACDAFRVDGDGPDERLVRVAEAPEPEDGE